MSVTMQFRVEPLESRRLLSAVLVDDLNPGPGGSEPMELADVNGTLFFAATTPAAPAPALWKSDGTAGGTVMVKAGSPPAPWIGPSMITDAGDLAYFIGWDWELWRSDGTAAGTFPLTDVDPSSDVTIRSLTALGDRILFLRTLNGTSELWRSDGTVAGTIRVAELRNDLGSGAIPSLTRVGDAVYFGAYDAANGFEPWKTDGTAGGTTLLKDVRPGPGSSLPGGMTDVNGTLYFFTADPAGGLDLWKSDGTDAGTVKVRDLDTLAFYSRPTAVGDTFFFSANVGDWTGLELWKSDGTAAGTRMVKDIYPGSTNNQPNGSDPRHLTASGGLLYFTAFEPGAGRELWRSDGTEAGTRPVKDIAAGAGSAMNVVFQKLQDVGGLLYFVADDGAHGAELWRTDGTEAGTNLVADLYQGWGSNIEAMAASGGSLYFSAVDNTHGQELFGVPPPAAAVAGRHVFYNHSGFDGNDGAINAADDSAIATDKRAYPLAQSSLPRFENVTSFDKGLNGVMVDVAGLPQDKTLTAGDFEFRSGPDLSHLGAGPSFVQVGVRRGAGVDGSDRVTITWPDYIPNVIPIVPMAVANGWLQVTVKANEHTGLSTPDVFSFGNLIGETGDGTGTTGWRVSALDLSAVKRSLNQPAPIASTTDFNRDGRTSALDLAIVKRILNEGLPLLTAPAPAGAPPSISRRLFRELLA